MTRTLPLLVFITACLPDFPKRDFTEDPTHDYDGDGFTELQGDCDDNADAIFPGAPEICDDQDNDCDGRSDELEDADDDNYVIDAPIWYWDSDGDQFGDDRYIVAACARPDGYAEVPGDCDDTRNTVYPGATEFCNGGIDDDCDGKVDDGDDDMVGVATWYRDQDADGFGTPDETMELCSAPSGYVLNGEDCDDTNYRVYPNAAEVCDGIDNDCDEQVDDEDFGGVVGPAAWFPDADGDGHGDPALEGRVYACEAADGYTDTNTDCDDSRPESHPGAEEVCDSLDNDCDGVIDNDAVDAFKWYRDSDSDGFGDDGEVVEACAAPVHHVDDNTDCDDHRDTVHPGASELCSTATIDDNCDGDLNDEGAEDCTVFFWDGDDDGFGDDTMPRCQCLPDTDPPGESVPGFSAILGGDCDDGSGTVHPEAFEACSTPFDDNCDGGTNDIGAIGCTDFYSDLDADGYGVEEDQRCLCEPDGVYAALEPGDCDETDFYVNPAADEVCFDWVDNDCSGTIDGGDAIDASTWFRDDDGDGHGLSTHPQTACEVPDGYVALDTDCDDVREEVNPDQRESCFTAFDDNCDGSDNDPGANAEAGPTGGLQHFMDADGDDYGLGADSMWSCDDSDLYRTRAIGDCDDGNAEASPGEVERCATDFDDDCDGDDNDEGAVGCTTLFYDWDGDGYGIASTECRCISEGAYTAELAGDCNDAISSVNPGEGNCGLSGAISLDGADAVITMSSYEGFVQSAGDINGDGIGDLLVSQSELDVPKGGTLIGGAGAVHVWYGPVPSAMNADRLSGDGSADASVVGSMGGHALGHLAEHDRAMPIAGDLNGDGYGDLLVSMLTDPSSSSEQYTSLLVAGPLEGVTDPGAWGVVTERSDMAADPPWLLADITDDERDEVVERMTGFGVFVYSSERAYSTDDVMFAGSSLEPSEFEDIPGSAIVRSGELIEDWDGDGDSSGVDMMMLNRSQLEHYIALFPLESASVDGLFGDGMPETSLYELFPEGSDTEYSQSDVRFGHADSDGYLDMMVTLGGNDAYDPELGTIEDAGVTFIIHGPFDDIGIGELLDAATTVIRGGTSSEGGHGLGSSRAFVDVNGDGVDDPVLTSRSQAWDAGSMWFTIKEATSHLFYGPLDSGTLTAADSDAVFSLEDGTYGPRIHTADVTAVGDVNGDGLQDLVFGPQKSGLTTRYYLFYGQPTE